MFLLLGIVYFIVFTANTIKRNDVTFRLVNHTYQVIEKISDVSSLIFEYESQIRGFVISDNELFLSRMDSVEASLRRDIEELKQLVHDNNIQKKNFQIVEPLINKKISFQEEVLTSKSQSNEKALQLIASLQGKRISDSLVHVLQLMQTEEKRLLNIRIEANKNVSEERFNASLIIVVVAFILLTIALLKIEREHYLRKKSEAQYKNLIDNSSLVLFTTDLKGNFNYLSGKFKELTGYKYSELIGKNYTLLIDDEWRERVQAFYQDQVKRKTSESIIEFPIKTKSGEIKWVEQNVNLLRRKDAINGFQSFVKDITERKLVEQALARKDQEIRAKHEESQKLLQSILDHIPMVVYMKDLNGQLLIANKQFYSTFSHSETLSFEEAELNMLANESSSNKYTVADEYVKTNLKALEYEDVFKTNNGQRDMFFVKFPLLDTSNQLFAICNVGRDITELVRFQRQLITAKARAEKAETLQEEFLANMSHEIRTPMNGIIGMTNLMETTTLNDEQKEYIYLIKESSHILLNLINDILDLSKIKAGKMIVETMHFNLAETINSVVAPLEFRAKEKNVQIVRQVENVPVYLEGDQKKLIQILNNLIGNAVKFTDKGEISIQVKVLEERDDLHKLQFVVADSGIGISEEDLEYIFESFTQASDNMVKKVGGTGLGLAITKRLIEMQGGKIEAFSELGKGSKFCFEITYRVSSGQKQPKKYLQEQSSRKEREFVKGKRILLVEDNLVNQKVSSKLLIKEGLEVDLANDGKHAIDILAKGDDYDLIIMDLRMPMMDGFQTSTYIRNKLLLKVPIIAMTASVLRNEKAKCLEVGMNDYITKPFSPDALFNKMYHLLNPDETNSNEESSVQVTASNEFYNLSFIEEMEDDEYTSEILETFLQTTPIALEEIRSAILHADYHEVYSRVHKLKSSLGILQANSIFQLMNDIEILAQRTEGLNIIEEKFTKALQLYDLLQPMLEADLLEVKSRIN